VLRVAAAAATATVGALLVYATVQQNFRSGANDPQIQLAEDAAARLASDAAPASVVPGDTVDLARSLRPYVVVYGRDDRPLASSGVLEGRPPVPPAGVLGIARRYGEDRVTWEPRRDVRSAIVVHRVEDGSGRLVLAGRSLREVEAREQRLFQIVGIAWIPLLAGSIVVALL
jgi:hypothetical protein